MEPCSYSVSQALFDSLDIIHCKHAPADLKQMYQHDKVQQVDDDHLKNNWREEMTAADTYGKHRPGFLNVTENFRAMRDGH